jgi:hypothetical protein
MKLILWETSGKRFFKETLKKMVKSEKTGYKKEQFLTQN